MIRYLRLYLYFLRFSFSRAMEFRVDFFFRVFMDSFFYVAHLAFFTILYRHTAELGGWTLDQALIFASAIFVQDALQMTLFSNNCWWLPIYINRGDLDYYLIRPVSSLFFLSTRDFAANSFLNLILAGAIMVWALGRYPDPLPAVRIAIFLFCLLLGTGIYYCLRMVFLIPVFWIQSNRGFDSIFWSLEELGNRPDRIYPGWMHRILVSIIPFALMISYPTRTLFEGDLLTVVLHLVTVTGLGFALVIAFWRWGLRNYASASS